MCQISERFLLANKVFKNLSPGVGAHIQPGIKAFMDGEDLTAGTEAGHQGVGTLKEANSFQLGLTASLWAAGRRALHNRLYLTYRGNTHTRTHAHTEKLPTKHQKRIC